MTPGEKITQLAREIDSLNDEIAYANAMIEELESLVGDADGALMTAWDLLLPDARKQLLENKYAEEFFWNEPERIERDER